VPGLIFKSASIIDKSLLLVKTGKRHALTSLNPSDAWDMVVGVPEG
jgi:hypothetical protein